MTIVNCRLPADKSNLMQMNDHIVQKVILHVTVIPSLIQISFN